MASLCQVSDLDFEVEGEVLALVLGVVREFLEVKQLAGRTEAWVMEQLVYLAFSSPHSTTLDPQPLVTDVSATWPRLAHHRMHRYTPLPSLTFGCTLQSLTVASRAVLPSLSTPSSAAFWIHFKPCCSRS